MSGFGLMEVLLMSVFHHAAHHAAALPHVEQRLPVLVPHVLRPQAAGQARSGTRTEVKQREEAHRDLVELSKIQSAVSVDGGPDVLAVLAVFDQLQLSNAAHVGEPRLDLCHVQNLEGKRCC